MHKRKINEWGRGQKPGYMRALLDSFDVFIQKNRRQRRSHAYLRNEVVRLFLDNKASYGYRRINVEVKR